MRTESLTVAPSAEHAPWFLVPERTSCQPTMPRPTANTLNSTSLTLSPSLTPSVCLSSLHYRQPAPPLSCLPRASARSCRSVGVALEPLNSVPPRADRAAPCPPASSPAACALGSPNATRASQLHSNPVHSTRPRPSVRLPPSHCLPASIPVPASCVPGRPNAHVPPRSLSLPA